MQPYRVIGIEPGNLRILNDQGRPFLNSVNNSSMILRITTVSGSWRSVRTRELAVVVLASVPWLCGPPAAATEKKQIAVLVADWFPGSHPDVIAGRILKTSTLDGQGPPSALEVASVFRDQPSERDVSPQLARTHGFRICDTVAEALTLGTDGMAVDGVILSTEWAAAWRYRDREGIESTWFALDQGPAFMHFALQMRGIEDMMLSGRPAWPAERTLMTSGALHALLLSKTQGGRRIETPYLLFSYRADWTWEPPAEKLPAEEGP